MGGEKPVARWRSGKVEIKQNKMEKVQFADIRELSRIKKFGIDRSGLVARLLHRVANPEVP